MNTAIAIKMPATAAAGVTGARTSGKIIRPGSLSSSEHSRNAAIAGAYVAIVSWATKVVDCHLRLEPISKLIGMRGSKRPTMRKLPFKLLLFLLVLSGPASAQTEAVWEKYQPGVVETAISNGKSVLLGYLSTW